MPAVSEMPNVQKLPVRDRVAAMATWLRAYGEPLRSDSTSDVRSAWRAVRRKLDKQAARERERATHDAAGVSAPLPSSVRRVHRRNLQRNAEEGRQLFGLFIDVPWSAWDGYDEGTGKTQRGMVWDYNRDTKRFTIRFVPDGEWVCDDIPLTWQLWQQLLGETPCHASAEERAKWSEPELLDFPDVELTPQPRGHHVRHVRNVSSVSLRLRVKAGPTRSKTSHRGSWVAGSAPQRGIYI